MNQTNTCRQLGSFPCEHLFLSEHKNQIWFFWWFFDFLGIEFQESDELVKFVFHYKFVRRNKSNYWGCKWWTSLHKVHPSNRKGCFILYGRWALNPKQYTLTLQNMIFWIGNNEYLKCMQGLSSREIYLSGPSS